MKKFISFSKMALLVFMLGFASVSVAVSVWAFDNDYTAPNERYVVSYTDTKIAPGIDEREIVTNNISGTNQVMGYAVEIDLSNSTNEIIAGYANMDGNSWGMQTVREQANAAIAKGKNVVAGFNGGFFNMSTGEPTGALVMNGVEYKAGDSYPFFGILNDGTAVIGDSTNYNQYKDSLKEAVGGHVNLIVDGEICLQSNEAYITGVNPRTSVGLKADGTVVFYVADGRNYPTSNGMTIIELAEMMLSLGCVSAINLDGGGSTTYAARIEGTTGLQVRNRPSDLKEREVSATLLIVSNAKADGEFDHASITPNNEVYTPNSVVDFDATGVDGGGYPIQIPDGATWELADSSFGIIDSDGIFSSNGKTGEVTVNLVYNDSIVGTTKIIIAVPEELCFTSDEISLGFDVESDLGFYALYKGRKMNVNDNDFIWSYPDGIGTFNGNKFISSDSNSITGTVTVKYQIDDSTEISASLTLVVGKLPVVVYDFEYDNTQALLDAGWTSVNYGRGGIGSVELVDYDSGEPTRFGNSSMKLNYDFTQMTTEATEGASAGMNDSIEIPGSPTAIGLWVYAPEEAQGFWLRARVKDSSGTIQQVDFTYQPGDSRLAEGENPGINWTGWKYVEGSLTGFSGPFTIQPGEFIRFMYVPGIGMGTKSAGCIYIDNIQFVYGANVDDVDSPIIDSIKLKEEVSTEEVEVDGQVFTSNRVTISATYHDIENKYTTGIDYDKINVYIDGINYRDNEKFYVNTKTDNKVYLNDIYLENGDHEIKVVILDGFGNETSAVRYFTIEGNVDDYVYIDDGDRYPELGQNYEIDIKSNNVYNISSIDASISFGLQYTNFTVEFTEGYTGTYSYNEKLKVLYIQCSMNDQSKFIDGEDEIIAKIFVSIPHDLTENSVLKYATTKGSIEYHTASTEENHIDSFAIQPTSVTVKQTYTIVSEIAILNCPVKVYVYNGKNVASGIDVYYQDGTLLGTTNEDGYFETNNLTDSIKQFTLYAMKDGYYSYSVTSQSLNAAGDVDGTPYNVLVTAVDNSSTSKNITWFSNPTATTTDSILQVAIKSDYEEKGELAFTEYNGTSIEYAFIGSSVLENNYAVRINMVVATGLKDNVEYVYRVGDGNKWSEIKTFKLYLENHDVNFFIIGDTQTDDFAKLNKIFDALNTNGIDYAFGIQTGDLVDNASVYANWDGTLGTISNSVIGNIDMIYALGNHEIAGDPIGEVSYYYYNFAATGMSLGEKYYSVEYGNVYVAVFNYMGNDTESLNEAIEWLKEDTKNTTAAWKILVTHQPPYYTNISGGNAIVNEMLPSVCEEAGIDFVFSGHDHSYARTEPLLNGEVSNEGVVYYICGSTGEKSYSITNNPDFHFASLCDDYGSVYISVSTSAYDITITAYDGETGSIIDTYTKKASTSCVHNGHKEYYVDGDKLICCECNYTRYVGDYSGWAKDLTTGASVLFVNGSRRVGHFVVGEGTYLFDENGLAVTGTVVEDGVEKIYEDGLLVGGYTGFADVNGNTLYYENGKYKTGWFEYERSYYYFAYSNGYMVKNTSTVISDVLYTFDSNGVLIKGGFNSSGQFLFAGVIQTGWYEIDGTLYYLDSEGRITTEFATINNDLYYFDENGNTQTGWFYVNGNAYYATNSGTLVKEDTVIDGINYQFSNYILQNGSFVKKDDGLKYFYAGSAVVGDYETHLGSAYFDENGVLTSSKSVTIAYYIFTQYNDTELTFEEWEETNCQTNYEFDSVSFDEKYTITFTLKESTKEQIDNKIKELAEVSVDDYNDIVELYNLISSLKDPEKEKYNDSLEKIIEKYDSIISSYHDSIETVKKTNEYLFTAVATVTAAFGVIGAAIAIFKKGWWL